MFKSRIYKILLFLWAYYPFKKHTLLLIRFCKIPNAKFKTDLWFHGSFLVRGFSTKFNLYATKGDLSTLSIFWDGIENGWDAQSLSVWSKLSARANFIYDIGSNIGLYAIMANKINPNARVYAFEPSKKMRTILKKNVELNNLDITISSLAISNVIGTIPFFDLNVPTAVASLKLNDNLKSCEQLESYTVETTTFASFVENDKIKGVDLISIDVELNEPEVLEGMGNLIKKFKPDFIIEVLNNEIGEKIETYFNGLDYLFFEIDEQNGLVQRNHIYCEKDVSHSFNFLICKQATARYLKLIENE